jgi:hypothetical protein
MKSYQLEEVFGISRDFPVNYVKRNHVDDDLIDSLTRKKHIIIYGSSKQGKTCLRKKCLPTGSYITIHCSNKIDIADLNQLILKGAGFQLTTSNNTTLSGKAKAKAVFGINFLAKIGVEASGEGEIERGTIRQPLDLDLEDTNDVIDALTSINFSKYIVLDDFHYLTLQTQKDFSFALKIFHEKSDLVFIIVGVWLEENRLIALNGDLAGRITPINVEKWTSEDLYRVIHAGEKLLNIELAEELAESIIQECYDNVYILQEICYRICKIYKINRTLDETFYIGNNHRGHDDQAITFSGNSLNVSKITKEIIDQHTGRYHSFIIQFSDGFQNSEIETYRWLLFPVLNVEIDELYTGLRFDRIKEILIDKHPDGKNLNSNNLSFALKSLANIQLEKGITPNILDFDQTSLHLNVVDRAFLIWLSFQQKDELLKLAGFK